MNPKVQRNHATNDRWLVSYADFITLLFSFFVVLYAFSKADQKKQVEVEASIDTAFKSLGIFGDVTRKSAKNALDVSGKDQAAVPMNIVMGEDVMSPARVKEDLENIRHDLSQKLSNQIAHHTVSIQMGRDGLVISLREAGYFESGSASPRPETVDTLRRIAGSVAKTPYDVRIEGHTDNVPIHNEQFDSNWELSSGRATRIARMFLDLNAMAPQRLSAAAYAEFHPVAGNETEEGRAQNRRVDIVVLPRTKINLAASGAQSAGGDWEKITDD
jgi:chemotaxis protein MotB